MVMQCHLFSHVCTPGGKVYLDMPCCLLSIIVYFIILTLTLMRKAWVDIDWFYTIPYTIDRWMFKGWNLPTQWHESFIKTSSLIPYSKNLGPITDKIYVVVAWKMGSGRRRKENFLNHPIHHSEARKCKRKKEKSSLFIDFVLGTFIYHIRKLSHSMLSHGGALCFSRTQKLLSVNRMPPHNAVCVIRKELSIKRNRFICHTFLFRMRFFYLKKNINSKMK